MVSWRGSDLAELAGPEVADAQFVLQKGGDGVAGAVRVGRGAGIRAEQGQHLPLGGQDDAAWPQSLAGQAQLLGELAFPDQNPRLLLSWRTRNPVLPADWQLGPGHLPDVVPQDTGGTFDDRRRASPAG